MSKITFGENFYSSLLLSTFLGAVVVSAGFISSATAMERSPSGYGSSEDERDLPVAVNGMSLEERNSVAVRLELKEERRELKQFLASVRTQPSYLSLTADDWADFNQAMTSTTGALSESYTENRSPATRMAKIKAWLGDRQADRQAEQEMGRFLASVRTQPSYLSLTADDWADFNQAMTSSTGKFSLSYAENQRPATRMAKIKAWLEARHVLRSAEQQIDNFLANVKTQPSYTSLTADDWAAFDHEMTSSTGEFSLSYAENQRPATRMAKIKSWLEARQADRQAEQEMDRFLANVKTQPSYTSLTADDWAAFDHEMTSSTGKFSLSYAENQRPATRMAKIKAWLDDRRPAR